MATTMSKLSTPAVEPAPREPLVYYSSASTDPSSRTTMELNGGGGADAYGAVAEAGKPLVVSTAGGSTDIFLPGESVAAVTVQYRINDGPWTDAAVEDPLSSGRIEVPLQAHAVAYHYRFTTNTGRTVVEDAKGKNYTLDVIPAGGTSIVFDRAWNEVPDGPIHSGGTVRLVYDIDRLLNFMSGTSHNGAPTWEINAYLSFNGRPAIEVPLTGTVYDPNMIFPELVPVRPAIKVPSDARHLTVWFRGSAIMPNYQWDSNYSANYRFAVSS